MRKLKINSGKCPGRKFTFVCALLLIWALAANISAGQPTTIRFKQSVQIDGTEVFLGQMASIEGGDDKVVQLLKNMVIGKAPLPGQSRRFNRNHLEKCLQQHPIDQAAVIVEAPPHVDVTRRHIEIQKQEIENIVSEFIVQQPPRKNQTLRIKELRAPRRVILPRGRIAYKVSAPRSRQLMGRCPIAVDFSVDGHLHKKVWVTATIEVRGPAVVTRKPLGRHKPIAAEDIEVQILDLANLPANVLSDPGAVIGKRTRRAIGALTPLRADSIELPPLVKRGDLVVIMAESENLKITTLGQVKKKGRLGERIPVVNLDSKKVLHAVVVDANTVKIDF
ncbi:MAG: flagellar basal body P-ring formation chaperone FlgA [Desulfobacterales bacterium]|jgi:flagella basal body P-ring formation protein FlgA